MSFLDPDFADRVAAAAEAGRRRLRRTSMDEMCQIGRRENNPIFDDQHNWTDPCPNKAFVRLGLFTNLRACHTHADAIIDAYNQDRQQ